MKLIYLLAVLLYMQALQAQQKNTYQLQGIVLNTEEKPVSGATIRVSQNSTLSDATGKFSITVKENDTLSISHSGYTSITLPVNPSTGFVTVHLEAFIKQLDDLTVFSQVINPYQRKGLQGLSRK